MLGSGRLTLRPLLVERLPDGGVPTSRLVSVHVRFELSSTSATTGASPKQPVSRIAFGDACSPAVMTLPDRGTPGNLLRYTLFSRGYFGTEELASGVTDAQCLVAPTAHRLCLPLTPAHVRRGRLGAVAAAPSSATPTLHVEAAFLSLLPGVLVLALHRGASLANRDRLGLQDPYVVATAGGGGAGGHVVARSSVIAGGGTDVDWQGETLSLWMSPHSWTAPLTVSVWDRDVLTADDLIGCATITDPAAWLVAGDGDAAAPPLRATLELVARGEPAGSLTLTHAFYPAGLLVVRINEARWLPPPDATGTLVGGDAGRYVDLTLLSAVAPPVRVRTRPAVGAPAFPTWDDGAFNFNVVDARELRLRVRDAARDRVTGDAAAAVGEVVLDLSPAFRYGETDAWVPLMRTTTWGERVGAGEVRVTVTFSGPRGHAYPALHPGARTYDESERRQRPPPATAAHRDEAATPPAGASTARGPAPRSVVRAAVPASAADAGAVRADSGAANAGDADVLSAAEAAAAFSFLDLDGNRAVGAAELRHLLACMGEAVTDAEVDAMVALADTDGAGQVSLAAFSRLVTRPLAEPVPRRSRDGARPPPAPPLDVRDARGRTIAVVAGGTDAEARRAALQRTAGATAAARKRAACEDAVTAHSLRLPELWDASLRHARGATVGRQGCRVGLPALTTALACGRDDRAVARLHAAYAAGDGAVDLREVLLALSGCVGAPRRLRARLCFTLYDGSGSGRIDGAALSAMLRAAHPAATDADVTRRAAMLLDAAAVSGGVTLDEFETAAERFSGLLNSAWGGDGATAH